MPTDKFEEWKKVQEEAIGERVMLDQDEVMVRGGKINVRLDVNSFVQGIITHSGIERVIQAIAA